MSYFEIVANIILKHVGLFCTIFRNWNYKIIIHGLYAKLNLENEMFKKNTNENYVKVWKLRFENQLTKNAKSLIIIGSSQEDTSMILDLKGNDFHFQKTKLLFIPPRFRKAGRVRCGGARETHWATYHNGVTPGKTKEFLKSLCFFRSFW